MIINFEYLGYHILPKAEMMFGSGHFYFMSQLQFNYNASKLKLWDTEIN